jgi:hypothetical protein
MQEELIVEDHAPSTPPITPDNCDLVICYDFSTKETVPYLVNKIPKEVSKQMYYSGILDIGNWIVKCAVKEGILVESSKRSRGPDE